MPHRFALFDAFTAQPFGGSQAVIVADASDIPREDRIRIAKEFGYPATCFVDAIGPDFIKVQFFSTVMEQPMCGHGTVCLMHWAVEEGYFDPPRTGRQTIALDLPGGRTRVALSRTSGGAVVTMLEVTPARFAPCRFGPADIAPLLSLELDDFHQQLPMEVGSADFVHLVIPVAGLEAMRRIKPDFAGITEFCHAHGIGTFAAFSLETEAPSANLHVRDFCPAVGVPESASAGTTNAALAVYLTRHGHARGDALGAVQVIAEQGIEIGRRSLIQSVLEIDRGEITRVAVGGEAVRVAEGVLKADAPKI